MRRVLLAALGWVLAILSVAAVGVWVVATMPDDEPGVLPDLPDGNTRGDDLLTWAADYPDRTLAPDYLEDQ